MVEGYQGDIEATTQKKNPLKVTYLKKIIIILILCLKLLDNYKFSRVWTMEDVQGYIKKKSLFLL